MAIAPEWSLADAFTAAQAAYLWQGINPPNDSSQEVIRGGRPPGVAAIIQALFAAFEDGHLDGKWIDELGRRLRDPYKLIIRRTDLESFARSKQTYAAFLFDTLMVQQVRDAQPPSMTEVLRQIDAILAPANAAAPPEKAAKKGGRPEGYDWNACMAEIVRLADEDHLHGTQANLLRHLQEWFIAQCGDCPSESTLKARISPIYQYLEKIGWKPNRP